MATDPAPGPRLLDRLPASAPLFIGVMIGAAAVSIALGIKIGQGLANPSPSSAVAAGDEGEPQDDPDAFASWLLGSGDENGAVDQYVAAERALREQVAKQAQLEQQGDNRALVLRGLGAVAQPWDWLGPRNFGGRTRAFVVNPSDPSVMLAGGITGGIWRSENRGESWSPLTDTFSNISIGVLEIDPSNPKVVYAGTGEAYYRWWPRHRGNGIMKSLDGGISWSFLESTAGNDAFDWVGDIEVSPNDGRRVYAATGTGVWLSIDGGMTWGTEPVLPTSGGQDSVGCMELAIRSDQEPDVVFASCGIGRSPDGVYRSVGGTKWDKVLPADSASIGFAALAIAPSNQDMIYASVPDTGQNARGLYRSTAGGAPGTWELRANPGSGSPDWLANCAAGGGQGDYDNAIAVDPTDPNRLWLGGVDLFRSDDGGQTLRIASDWSLDPGASAYVHADQHAIVFDPGYDGTSNRVVYFANDGGLYRTDDDRGDLAGSACAAARGVRFQSMNQGYGITQFVSGSVTDDGSVLIGGTQDNGTYRLDSSRPGEWTSIWGGDGGNGAVHPTGDYLVVSNYFTRDKKTGRSYFYLYRLTGSARSGESAACRDYEDDPECVWIGQSISDASMLFYPPVERDPSNAGVLWTAGSRIWRSLDTGANWARVGIVDGVASAVAVAPSDSRTVYVGDNYGNLYRSVDADASAPSWAPLDVGGVRGVLGSIAVDPADPQTVFVAFKTFDGQQLWRSAHGGAFTPIDAGLPETPVNTVAINPRNAAMIYVGTDIGVFESLDGGDTWRVANENLATTIVSRLVFRPGSSDLYAFTFGRGVYRVDVGDESPPVNDLIESAKDVALAPDYHDTEDIRRASIAADDPALSCGSSLAPAQTRSVWYRLAGQGAGRVAVTTEGSNFDTVVAVHAVPAGGQRSEVQCNDDSVAALGPSSLVFEAATGAIYYIEVTRSAGSPTDTLANTLVLTITRA